MRLLFVGDVVGTPGRRVLTTGLRRVVGEEKVDLVVANGENCAGGAGMTPATVREIFEAGCHVITSGNHVWDRKEILPCLASDERVLRPANYPGDAPGRGVTIVNAPDGTPVAVVNLMGRVFMGNLEDPFRAADALIEEIGSRAEVILVDFHAEATSEKIAMGWYLDGRVSAVVGTHTHVATADERVLPGGTAYITDVGMTGPHDSVIGVEKAHVLERFLSQRPRSYGTATGDVRLSGVLVDVSPADGRAAAIRRVELREEDVDATP